MCLNKHATDIWFGINIFVVIGNGMVNHAQSVVFSGTAHSSCVLFSTTHDLFCVKYTT